MFRRKAKPVLESPEWMIVGLGNPGPEYAGTRHNVGFELVERLARSSGIRLDTRKHRAAFGQGVLEGKPVLLVKPMTYMNLSGQAVAPIMRQAGLGPERVLVVSDDIDLPTARVRMRAQGGSGGHNGHKSVIASLGTQEYPRLRIGIGRSNDTTIDHVLSRFAPDEREAINEALNKCEKAVLILLAEGLDRALIVANAGNENP